MGSLKPRNDESLKLIRNKIKRRKVVYKKSHVLKPVNLFITPDDYNEITLNPRPGVLEHKKNINKKKKSRNKVLYDPYFTQ